jgi:hypothetical protein
MVVAVGFEPTFLPFSMFSLSLIFAFLYSNLYALIQAVPSYCKHFLASLCNNGKKKACRRVSPVWLVSAVCRAQSWPVSVSDCVGRGAGVVGLGWPVESAVAGHCARLARLVAGLVAGRGRHRLRLVGRAGVVKLPPCQRTGRRRARLVAGVLTGRGSPARAAWPGKQSFVLRPDPSRRGCR